MINHEIKLDFSDLLIPPCVVSDIESRKSINVYDEFGMLPLFTAPMDTVVSYENYRMFSDHKIHPMLPRTVSALSLKDCWKALGLKDFQESFLDEDYDYEREGIPHICIDIANGHMRKLLDMTKKAKDKYGKNLILMVGNIANPETFKIFEDAGADYIRVGIGNGGGCLTTRNSGIGYPMASLIDEINTLNPTSTRKAKLVADGGMKTYDDIYKALALGSDYVMIGTMFNKALESAGETFLANKHHPGSFGTEGFTEPGEKVSQYDPKIRTAFKNGANFYKKFRGMSTKEVQKLLGGQEIRTSEGVTRMQPVEYTLEGWVENFKDYLATNMSYVGKTNLKDFIGQITLNRISQNGFLRFNK